MPGTAPNPTPATRRWPLLVAAAIAASTAALHLFSGTPEFVGPLLRSDLDPAVQQLFRALWHTCTLVLVLLPVALVRAARADRVTARPLLVHTWCTAAAFTGVFLAVDLDAFGTAVLTLPQWTLFVPLLVLIPLARLAPRA